jgi:hypothetical protein
VAKDNPFIKKAEAAAAFLDEDEMPPAPEPEPEPEPLKATNKRIQTLCDEIIEGKHDDDALVIAQALDQRREIMKRKLAAQIRAVYGDDYTVTKIPGARAAGAPTAATVARDRHPNEVDLSPTSVGHAPDVSLGYGSPNVHDGAGASGVVVAHDPMGAGGESGEFMSTGAQIG